MYYKNQVPIYDDDDDDDDVGGGDGHGGGAVVEDELYDIIKMMLLQQTIFKFNIYICVSCLCLFVDYCIRFLPWYKLIWYEKIRYNMTDIIWYTMI